MSILFRCRANELCISSIDKKSITFSLKLHLNTRHVFEEIEVRVNKIKSCDVTLRR
jgi:hypothetical protein